MNNLPKISICTITYGHENYISQCIEGVLMQEGDFELEFIISSDHSPDNTAIIVEDFMKNHPKGKFIKFINHQENMGIMPNFHSTLKQATGDYVALCDGDDYWTDPLKLQKQLHFLEKNREIVAVGHNTRIFDNTNKVVLDSSFPFKNEFQIDENLIYKRNYIPALSLFFRNIKPVPDWFLQCKIGDYPLILYLSQFGKLGFQYDVMADYRKFSGYHSNESVSKRNNMLADTLEIALLNLNKLTLIQKKLLQEQIVKLKINGSLNFVAKIQTVFSSDVSFFNKLKLLILILK